MTPQFIGSLMLTVLYSVNCEDFSATINALLLNVRDDNIEDGENLITSVTLCQHRKDNGLGHNNEEKCSEL